MASNTTIYDTWVKSLPHYSFSTVDSAGVEGNSLPPDSFKPESKDQSWFWTDYWQELEKAASEDLKEGRVLTFHNISSLIESLDEDQ